jgi:hypothetical protein
LYYYMVLPAIVMICKLMYETAIGTKRITPNDILKANLQKIGTDALARAKKGIWSNNWIRENMHRRDRTATHIITTGMNLDFHRMCSMVYSCYNPPNGARHVTIDEYDQLEEDSINEDIEKVY